MHFLFVRHTEIVGREHLFGWTDAELSPAGEAMLEPLAREVASHRPTRVFSSDLTRCRRLASAIAQSSGLLEIQLRPDLREENFGRWEGRPWGDLLRGPDGIEARAFLAGFTWRTPPGGESFGSMASRVFEECGRIEKECDGDGVVAVVTHSGPMRALACRAHGLALTHAMESRFEHPYGGLLKLWSFSQFLQSLSEMRAQ